MATPNQNQTPDAGVQKIDVGFKQVEQTPTAPAAPAATETQEAPVDQATAATQPVTDEPNQTTDQATAADQTPTTAVGGGTQEVAEQPEEPAAGTVEEETQEEVVTEEPAAAEEDALPFEDELRELHKEDPSILSERNEMITDRVLNRAEDLARAGESVSNGAVDDIINQIVSEAGLSLDMNNPEHIALMSDIKSRLRGRADTLRDFKDQQTKLQQLDFATADELAARYNKGELTPDEMNYLKKNDPDKYNEMIEKDKAAFEYEISQGNEDPLVAITKTYENATKSILESLQ